MHMWRRCSGKSWTSIVRNAKSASVTWLSSQNQTASTMPRAPRREVSTPSSAGSRPAGAMWRPGHFSSKQASKSAASHTVEWRGALAPKMGTSTPVCCQHMQTTCLWLLRVPMLAPEYPSECDLLCAWTGHPDCCRAFDAGFRAGAIGHGMAVTSHASRQAGCSSSAVAAGAAAVRAAAAKQVTHGCCKRRAAAPRQAQHIMETRLRHGHLYQNQHGLHRQQWESIETGYASSIKDSVPADRF